MFSLKGTIHLISSHTVSCHHQHHKVTPYNLCDINSINRTQNISNFMRERKSSSGYSEFSASQEKQEVDTSRKKAFMLCDSPPTESSSIHFCQPHQLSRNFLYPINLKQYTSLTPKTKNKNKNSHKTLMLPDS